MPFRLPKAFEIFTNEYHHKTGDNMFNVIAEVIQEQQFVEPKVMTSDSMEYTLNPEEILDGKMQANEELGTSLHDADQLDLEILYLDGIFNYQNTIAINKICNPELV